MFNAIIARSGDRSFSSLKQKDNGKIFWKVGDYDKAKSSDNVREIERFYKTSMVAHAPMEPMSALVNFVDEKLHIYAVARWERCCRTYLHNSFK